MSQTLTLCKLIEQTGVRALAVHARRVEDRPRHAALCAQVPEIVRSVSLPVIYNGDVFAHSDIAALKAQTGAHSIMIARGAMWNASIFRAEGMLPVFDVMTEYLTICRQYDNAWNNTKYGLQEMAKEFVGGSQAFKLLLSCRSYADVQPSLAAFAKEEKLTRPYVPPHIAFEPRPVKMPKLRGPDAASGADDPTCRSACLAQLAE